MRGDLTMATILDWCVCVSPSDGAALLVVDLDELPEATGVVVVSCLGIPKSLKTGSETENETH